ncbi:MAG: Fe-S cluster assembly protein SufD [Acidobacteriia bacterium]|nr:Fe-S cluster assembly protein SufD [Terriglobia bacterium]
MTPVAEQTGAWLESFTRQHPAAPWIRQLREEAFARFTQMGFPTTHDEEWRFTNVAPIARSRFQFRDIVGQVSGLPANVQAGAIAGDARQWLAKQAFDQNAFVALNTAFLNGGLFLRIPRGTVVEGPIEVVYSVDGQVGNLPHVGPRMLVVAGADTQFTLIERYTGQGRYLTNAVTEIVAGEGAVIDHYKVQHESGEAFHIGSLFANLGRSVNFSATSIAMGGALVRNDVNVTLSEGTEATLNGLYVVNGSQHVDNHTTIDHAKPHGTSHELYKGILDGKAGAVFNGRIMVRKDAQKTDSKQTNKNLVLSDEAVINTKPELQIFADDVRCTHGATIGQLDAESMFYLQSRGIGKDDARNLLTYAFAQDIVDRIKVQSLRDSLERILFEKLHERPQ